METYVVLVKFTQQGFANLKHIPERIGEGRREIEDMGGKLLAWFSTMRQYDVILITQVLNAKSAAQVSLGVDLFGNVRTETMRAFTEAEFAAMVEVLL